MQTLAEKEWRFLKAAGILSLVTLTLFIARIAITGDTSYYFIPFNLGLAWIGLIISWLLATRLKNRIWHSWSNMFLTLLWLFFLPNTWYVLTDFIHLTDNGEVSQLYDIVAIFSLVITGFVLGFASLYVVHEELKKRLKIATTNWLMAGVILLSSFAIYLGRDLRWNSWDVFTNPAGVLVTVSDRLVDPLSYPRMLKIAILFFGLIGSMYFAFRQFLSSARSH